MSAQQPTPRVPRDPPIFQITHVDNLPGILAAGGLLSDAQVRAGRTGSVTDVGYDHIKARRMKRRVPVAAGGVLGSYVPFYFCARSVMLYVLHAGHESYSGGQEPIVHLVSSARRAIATGLPWAFTDRHAELQYATYFENLAHLGRVDWRVMGRKQWGGDQEVKECRQAEFLVHERFPWAAFSAIAVIDQAMQRRVESLLAGASHRPVVEVRQAWYY